MATSKKKRRKKTAARSNAAGGRKKKMFSKRRRRQGNPGTLGNAMDWVTGGAGVLAGVVGTRALPQLVLGASNTGAIGYAANAVTAAALGFAAHMAFPRSRVLALTVTAGGFAALIARVITDYTSYGKYLSLTGVGDYMVSNAVAPQRIVDPRAAMVEIPSGWGMSPPAAISSSGVDDYSGAAAGVDLGSRAGVC